MTELDPEVSSDSLIRLLERQKELVAELGRLAETQGPLIESGESDALLELLSKRQQIMDQFTISQDDMTRLTAGLGNDATGVEQGPRERIGDLIDEITDQLAVIMHRDENDRVSLQANRNHTAEALSGMRAAGRARQAYLKARAVTNRFADRRG